jgi:hypothetical protein
MKICRVCLTKYDGSTNQKQGDQCTEKNCHGKIIEVEDIVAPIFISLSEKNYQINYSDPWEPLITAANGFSVSLFPIQFNEILPPLPSGFTKRLSSDSVIIERELKSTDPNDRHAETEKIVNDFSIWVKELSPIVIIMTNYQFNTKENMEKLRDELLKYGNYYKITVLEKGENVFSIDTLCVVKFFNRREEFAKMFSFYEKTNSESVLIKELWDFIQFGD